MSDRRLLDLHEAGAYCSVSYWTIRSLVDAGEIPTVKLPNPRRKGETVRRLLVDRQDLDALIETWKDRT
jgi:hypothetical protein